VRPPANDEPAILGSIHLDEAKLEALRRWGQGLRGARTEEHAAAGRAILMLIAEVERLRLETYPRAVESDGPASGWRKRTAREGVSGPFAHGGRV
jgi:hypothetical protein